MLILHSMTASAAALHCEVALACWDAVPPEVDRVGTRPLDGDLAGLLAGDAEDGAVGAVRVDPAAVALVGADLELQQVHAVAALPLEQDRQLDAAVGWDDDLFDRLERVEVAVEDAALE